MDQKVHSRKKRYTTDPCEPISNSVAADNSVADVYDRNCCNHPEDCQDLEEEFELFDFDYNYNYDNYDYDYGFDDFGVGLLFSMFMITNDFSSKATEKID